MKVLIFGVEGQLGTEVEKRARDLRWVVEAPKLAEVDITDDGRIIQLCKESSPELVVNCAAYTAVDKAEDEAELALKVNADGAGNVARAAQAINARVIHISTDYVFDGTYTSPMDESTPTAPLGSYGASKLAGEQQVLEYTDGSAVVLRTSWLHGSVGPKVVHTMLRLVKERELVRVVDDQQGSPTWAGWLADVIVDVARLPAKGIYHATCSGSCSWYEFARAILRELRERSEATPLVKLEPQSTAEAAYPAPRPAYSVLDCTRLAELLEREPMSWQDGLSAHLDDLDWLN